MTLGASAQREIENDHARILFILDASSSMTYSWNSDSRFDEAKQIIGRLVDSLNNKDSEIQFSLRLIGSQFPASRENCYDTKLVVPFNKDNGNLVKQSLKYTYPMGWSPINLALKVASDEDLTNSDNNQYGIILITDGEESCGGDVCATVEKYLSEKFFFQPYIIGLDPNKDLKSYYSCIGDYLPLKNKRDEDQIVQKILDFKLYKKPKINEITTARFPAANIPVIDSLFTQERVAAAEKERLEKERRAKEEADRLAREKARKEQERLAKLREEERAREEALRKAQEEAQEKARLAAEEKARQEAELLAKQKQEEADRLKAIEDARLAAEQRAKEEAERLAREEAERIAKEQAEEQARLAAEQKAKEEAERLAREEAERIAKEKAEEQARLAAEQRAKEEAERLAREEAERIAKEKAEEQARLAAEQKAKEEAERLAREQAEWEAKKKAEAEAEAKRLAEIQAKKEAEEARLAAIKEAEEKKKLEAEKEKAQRLAREERFGPSVNIEAARGQEKKNLTMDVEFKSTENSSLLIYLKGPNGKYYHTSPTMKLYKDDPNNPVMTFKRFIDRSGKPKPIEGIEEGNYTLAFGQSTLYVGQNVRIENNKQTIIVLEVQPGSISFVYGNNPNKKVTGYTAAIRKIFPDKTQAKYQQTDERVYYSPGNYHITLNTLPELEINVDVFLGSTSVVQLIKETGEVKIPTELPSEVIFFQAYSSSFKPFLRISPKSKERSFNLLPGSYMIEYFINDVPKRQKFLLKSNQIIKLPVN